MGSLNSITGADSDACSKALRELRQSLKHYDPIAVFAVDMAAAHELHRYLSGAWHAAIQLMVVGMNCGRLDKVMGPQGKGYEELQLL